MLLLVLSNLTTPLLFSGGKSSLQAQNPTDTSEIDVETFIIYCIRSANLSRVECNEVAQIFLEDEEISPIFMICIDRHSDDSADFETCMTDVERILDNRAEDQEIFRSNVGAVLMILGNVCSGEYDLIYPEGECLEWAGQVVVSDALMSELSMCWATEDYMQELWEILGIPNEEFYRSHFECIESIIDLPPMPQIVRTATPTVIFIPYSSSTESPVSTQANNSPSETFTIGDTLRVIYPSGVNLRNRPSVNASIVGSVDFGTLVVVQAGPFYQNGYRWWNVVASDDISGWVIEGLSDETRFLEGVTSAVIILTPTAGQPPTSENAVVQIVRIIDAGNITAEGVEIRNNGPVIDLTGWTLSRNDETIYTFPNERRLFQGGSLTVFTRVGDDTPIALYWDRDRAVWSSGATVVLSDSDGEVQSVFTVP